MFEKLNEFINYYAVDDSYVESGWYEDAFEDAIEILDSFNDDDWKKLLDVLPTKSDLWKQRLAYCMYDSKSSNHLKALLSLVDTDNEDLLKIVIGCLNRFDLESNEHKEEIINKIEQFMPSTSRISQDIFTKFIEKNSKSK